MLFCFTNFAQRVLVMIKSLFPKEQISVIGNDVHQGVLSSIKSKSISLQLSLTSSIVVSGTIVRR